MHIDSVEWQRRARRARDAGWGDWLAAALGGLARWLFHTPKRPVSTPERPCYDC